MSYLSIKINLINISTTFSRSLGLYLILGNYLCIKNARVMFTWKFQAEILRVAHLEENLRRKCDRNRFLEIKLSAAQTVIKEQMHLNESVSSIKR